MDQQGAAPEAAAVKADGLLRSKLQAMVAGWDRTAEDLRLARDGTNDSGKRRRLEDQANTCAANASGVRRLLEADQPRPQPKLLPGGTYLARDDQ